MMGANDLFKEALGDFADGEITANTLAAKSLIKSGLAVLLIEPGGKKPVCTLTARQAVTADNAAQKIARESGSANWDRVRHDCGVYHAMTDPKDLTKARVKEWLAAGANLAVVPAASPTRVIVVDLDTREERRGFMADWAGHVGPEDREELEGLAMTVTSPGVMSADLDGAQVWTHKDGGHFWFTLPEGTELPQAPGKLKGATGWTVYYGSGYVLVPPSVRSEGAYRLTGGTVDAPGWLLEAIRAGGTSGSAEDLKERIRAGETDLDIDSWSTETAWADLLGAHGWTSTGRLDTCGCPTWTRPGSPAHDKSATAHERGCPRYETMTGHGPIHAWSDAVAWGGQKTVTKLTFLAHEGFGGDMRAAMAHIGVRPSGGGNAALVLDPEELLDPEEAGLVIQPGSLTMTASETSPGPEDEDDELSLFDPVVRGDHIPEAEGEAPKAGEGEEPDSWRPRDLAALLAGKITRVEPTLLPRSDGRALLYPGKVHSFHGESESGKSLVLMGEAVRLIKAGQNVLWVTFDSDEEEDVARALRFGATPEEILAHLHYIRPEVAPTTVPHSYRAMLEGRYALAVIDGVVDAMGLITQGAKGDPNEVFSEFFRIFPKRVADRTGAATVLVDHVTKDAESRGRFAIGAQAKMAALTGAAYLVEPDKDNAPCAGQVGTVILRVGKDRPAGVRRYCGPRRARDRTQEAARVTLDDTGEFTVMTVEPPDQDPFVALDSEERPKADLPYQHMEAVARFLESRPDGVPRRDVETAVNGRAAVVRLAMNELIRLKYVEEDNRGRGLAKLLTLRVPYYAEYGDVPGDQDPGADMDLNLGVA